MVLIVAEILTSAFVAALTFNPFTFLVPAVMTSDAPRWTFFNDHASKLDLMERNGHIVVRRTY